MPLVPPVSRIAHKTCLPHRTADTSCCVQCPEWETSIRSCHRHPDNILCQGPWTQAVVLLQGCNLQCQCCRSPCIRGECVATGDGVNARPEHSPSISGALVCWGWTHPEDVISASRSAPTTAPPRSSVSRHPVARRHGREREEDGRCLAAIRSAHSSSPPQARDDGTGAVVGRTRRCLPRQIGGGRTLRRPP